MARIEGRMHRLGNSVTIHNGMFHAWLERAPEAGDEILFPTVSGRVGVFRVLSVEPGHDPETYFGKVRCTGLLDREENRCPIPT